MCFHGRMLSEVGVLFRLALKNSHTITETHKTIVRISLPVVARLTEYNIRFIGMTARGLCCGLKGGMLWFLYNRCWADTVVLPLLCMSLVWKIIFFGIWLVITFNML